MRLIRTTLAFFAAALSPVYAEEMVMIGKDAKVTKLSAVCTNYDDYKKMSSLMSDESAFTKYIYSKYPACRVVQVGTVIHLEDNAILSNSVCGREKGEVDCYWIPRSRVAPTP